MPLPSGSTLAMNTSVELDALPVMRRHGTLSVTLHDMTKLTGVMDQSLEQRLEGIDNIRYDNSKMDEHIHSAHLLAISDSKVKAQLWPKPTVRNWDP